MQRPAARPFLPFIALIPIVLVSCSDGFEDKKSATADPVGAVVAPVADTGRRVAGQVASRNGLPVIVTLETKDGEMFQPPAETPVMDQVALAFTPELLFARTGHAVGFTNNDTQIHNINVKHDVTREQAFNVALPTGGVYQHAFPKDGLYDVTCDIHTAMAAWVVATSTPYVTTTGPDGRFAFEGVPKGSYTLVAYIALRRMEKMIEVSDADTEVLIEESGEGDAIRQVGDPRRASGRAVSP